MCCAARGLPPGNTVEHEVVLSAPPPRAPACTPASTPRSTAIILERHDWQVSVLSNPTCLSQGSRMKGTQNCCLKRASTLHYPKLKHVIPRHTRADTRRRHMYPPHRKTFLELPRLVDICLGLLRDAESGHLQCNTCKYNGKCPQQNTGSGDESLVGVHHALCPRASARLRASAKGFCASRLCAWLLQAHQHCTWLLQALRHCAWLLQAHQHCAWLL